MFFEPKGFPEKKLLTLAKHVCGLKFPELHVFAAVFTFKRRNQSKSKPRAKL